ncbi:aminoacyl-tRNA hydrolase [uncultured Faecalicoccus sp.]|uniref:aminoacyl-tRNA hydrolase n=1 Tax=uncultured Faecalicoccus sp. TaxID=1971760 RepID=UPI0026333C12|nr:aminoacyl-tRNA hydrolase [uncultured Faecalicoccus sp.]
MKIIIGLGNPGRKYENTRHNAGFMVMDELAKLLNVSFDQEKFSAYFAKTKYKQEDVILLKPTTFMNNSGFALRQCLDFYKASTKEVLVIYDDVDLPVGKIRLRQKGSAGGHNGIKSIIECIFTNEFDRIRVGVGKDANIPMINWVLSKFKEEEKEDLDQAVIQSAKAAHYAITHSFMDTMNQYNKK